VDWTTRGRAHVLGHDIPHDGGVIAFDFVIRRVTSPEELLPHLFEEVDPTLRDRLRPGDFIVAGRNFLCGKAHNQGLIALKSLGIRILCVSMPFRSFRAAVGLAVPVLMGCAGITEHVRDGDEIEADMLTGTVTNVSTGQVRSYPPLPEGVRRTVASGGMQGLLRAHLARHPEMAEPYA
jgi:3-isopropylmalate/(R)-2-methylmalate dehydratase small subunit